MSDSVQPHGLQPTRLLCLWDSPGKNTGVGCPVLLQGIFPTQDQTHISYIYNTGRRVLYHCTTQEALSSATTDKYFKTFELLLKKKKKKGRKQVENSSIKLYLVHLFEPVEPSSRQTALQLNPSCHGGHNLILHIHSYPSTM